MTDSYRALLIEDNPGDVRLVRELVKDHSRVRLELEFASSLAEGMKRLEHDALDVVLVDLGLPDSQGIETFTRLHERFGHMPTLVLQQNFYSPAAVSPQDVLAVFFYFMHFPLPIVVGFVFWTSDREHYWRYVAALLGMSFASFIVFLFFPTTPPRLEPGLGVHWVTNETVHKLFSSYFVSPLYTHLNPNDYAAFPSLHAAFPTLAAIFAWRRYRGLAIGLLVWAACVWTAIVYLGEHYFVDALAGLGFALAAWVLVERVVPRLRRERRPDAERVA